MIPGWLYASIFSLLLAACGGGSGGSDPQADSGAGSRPPAEDPQPPSSGGEGEDGGDEVPSPEPTPSPEPQPPSSGGGDNGSGDSGGTVTPPSSGTDSGSTPPSEPTAPAFTAQLIAAPPAPPTGSFLGEQVADDGTVTYSDTVYFEVRGTGLRNVELVSANDTSIKYGTFTISADGTRAILNWDYQLGDENGAYTAYDLRVLAWNVPAGQAGESIEVMAPRRYFRRPSPGMCAVSGCVAAP